jgi:ABC-type tungstate transport system permease subunit
MKHFFLMLFAFAVSVAAQGQERLRVATTTSVQDSGLMPYLLPNFIGSPPSLLQPMT